MVLEADEGSVVRFHIVALGPFLYVSWLDERPGLRINTETGVVARVFP